MNHLFQLFGFIHAYKDDLLILTKWDLTDHVHKLELTLNKLKEIVRNCIIERSFFEQTQMEYLGFWVTCDGVKPIDKKVETIK